MNVALKTPSFVKVSGLGQIWSFPVYDVYEDFCYNKQKSFKTVCLMKRVSED